MGHRRVWGYFVLALLVVYGVVLPTAFVVPVSAHRQPWTLVRGGHLRYYDATESIAKFGTLIRVARDEWQPYVDIEIEKVSSVGDSDVMLTSFCGPNTDLLGATYAAHDPVQPRRMKFNRCLLNHKGGFVPKKNGNPSKTKKKATTSTRRQRTFVHEFGHALGLDHTPELLHKQAVMSAGYRYVGPSNAIMPIPNNTTTIYKLTDHDKDDASDRWP